MQTNRMVLTLLPFVGMGGVLWQSARSRPEAKLVEKPKATASASAKRVFAEYKKWKRVNPEPHRVESWLAALCRDATAQEWEKERGNPHNNKYVTVYVNKKGERAMYASKNLVFPVGSVIVKEKLTTPKSVTPELLTVMTKRKKGYNPAGGDWEYLVVNGTGTQIQAQGILTQCQSCHADWRTTDYVSRVYLPVGIRRKLQ